MTCLDRHKEVQTHSQPGARRKWVISITLQPLYPRERELVPIVQKTGWTLASVWTARKISPLPGFDPRTVQPVASRYTDYAISAAVWNVSHYLLRFTLLRPSNPAFRQAVVRQGTVKRKREFASISAFLADVTNTSA